MQEIQKQLSIMLSGVYSIIRDVFKPLHCFSDYRLQFGLNCTPSRRLSRAYLLKALSSPHATTIQKSMSHALLIDWYMNASDEDLRVRYAHAAAHHANQAAELSSGQPSPAVLWFAKRSLEPISRNALQFAALYKAVWDALEQRESYTEKKQDKAEWKRMKNVNRYRCANVGCEIQANSGKKLARCECG